MFNIKKFFKIEKDKSIFDEFACASDAVGMYNITSRLPNPDIILRKTGRGLQALRELKSNYQVGTCIESRKAGVTSKNWRLNKENCPDKQYKFFEEIFRNIDVHKLIEDILEAPLFGFTPIEISYEKQNGYIMPVKLTAKPQEWFYFSTDGEFFFNSIKYSDGLLIPENSPKFLLPKHRADFLNPYGECLLSRCFWNVVFINGGMEFWLKFMEKYGTPWAIGKYDRSMNENEQLQLFNTLKRMVQDAVAAIPNDGSVELLSAGDKSGSNDVYQSFITKCENNISKVILGQTLTTDVGSTGSYAAANIHSEVRGDLIQNDIRLVENTINEFIKKVSFLNFTSEDVPVFEFFEEQGIDQTIAERDNKVQNLGVKFTKEYIKKTYGYDDEDFEILEPECSNGLACDEQGKQVAKLNDAAVVTEANAKETKQSLIAQAEKMKDYNNDFADTSDDDYDKIDKLIGSINPDENIINDSLKPVIEMFKTSRDAETCLDMLAEVYPDMRTEELEKILTKVIFLAEVLGRVK